jgi:hypothetical protein
MRVLSRYARAIDENQPGIVDALRACGAGVQSLAQAGSGVPDLLVFFRGSYFLLEVKDSAKVPSARRLTPSQISWHSSWPGPVTVVESIEQALKAIGAIPNTD